MLVLGIETSCDETSAAVVKDGTTILSNVVATQFEFHRRYAGVVPEIASRRHSETINYVIEEALRKAAKAFEHIGAVAVTSHPGLIGSLLVGVIPAKTISLALGIPIIGIDHIEAHLYSVHFDNDVVYPIVGLVISGGHTLLLYSERPDHYEIRGSTIDDAVGEAFDKVAKHLGLGYPGGPAIQSAAENGSEQAFAFPRVVLDRKANRYNFSYSGLKNAVINQRSRFQSPGFDDTVENVAASFQAAATDVLLTKSKMLCGDLGIKRIALAGGVSNNARVRNLFSEDEELQTYLPAKSLTQDNAAMVAGAAYHRLVRGERSDLDFEPRSRITGIKKGKRKKDG